MLQFWDGIPHKQFETLNNYESVQNCSLLSASNLHQSAIVQMACVLPLELRIFQQLAISTDVILGHSCGSKCDSTETGGSATELSATDDRAATI
jgi:hypothetical protein